MEGRGGVGLKTSKSGNVTYSLYPSKSVSPVLKKNSGKSADDKRVYLSKRKKVHLLKCTSVKKYNRFLPILKQQYHPIQK